MLTENVLIKIKFKKISFEILFKVKISCKQWDTSKTKLGFLLVLILELCFTS